MTKGNSGITLVSALVSTVIAGVGIYAAQSLFLAAKKRLLIQSERVEASLLVTELLEVFRAHSSAQLLEYLKLNPVHGESAACQNAPCNTCVGAACPGACSTCHPYPLCAHVNILDRGNNKLVNRDEIAALSPDHNPSKRLGSDGNRFYRVQVVDAQTLQPVTARCGQTARSTSPLGSNERFLVTVGVSWISSLQGNAPPLRVVASTLVLE